MSIFIFQQGTSEWKDSNTCQQNSGHQIHCGKDRGRCTPIGKQPY